MPDIDAALHLLLASLFQTICSFAADGRGNSNTCLMHGSYCLSLTYSTVYPMYFLNLHQINPFHPPFAAAQRMKRLKMLPSVMFTLTPVPSLFSLQRANEDQPGVQVPKVILAGRCSKSHRAVHRLGIWVCR